MQTILLILKPASPTRPDAGRSGIAESNFNRSLPAVSLTLANCTGTLQALLFGALCAALALTPSSYAASPDVSGGNAHTLYLLGNGTVNATGLNASGQLGDGTTNDRSSPVPVVSQTTPSTLALTGISAIAAGASHSLFLKDDNTVWSTGLNTSGQLGQGNTTSPRNTPAKINNFSATAIAAGGAHRDRKSVV